MLFLPIFAFFVWKASLCWKRRKFYRENSTELIGTVIEMNKMPEYCMVIVQCEEEFYSIKSTHPRAKKYTEGKEVSILVIPHRPFLELPPEILVEFSSEIIAIHAKSPESRLIDLEKRLTILKDDYKTIGEFMLFVILAVFFGGLAAVSMFKMFNRNKYA